MTVRGAKWGTETIPQPKGGGVNLDGPRPRRTAMLTEHEGGRKNESNEWDCQQLEYARRKFRGPLGIPHKNKKKAHAKGGKRGKLRSRASGTRAFEEKGDF